MSDEPKERASSFAGPTLFTLVDKTLVLPPEPGSLIPSKDFGIVVDSIELLKRVQEDAESYKKAIVKECEDIKAQAEKEGFEEGYHEWAEMVRILENEVKAVREELQKSVLPVALRAAKKIVVTELETRPEVIVDIVMNTLKTVATHKRIVVYVNKKDFDHLDKGKSRLKSVFEELETLSLRERDDIEPGGCIVETEGGIINARMEDRWRTLETAFESLSAYLKEKKEAP